MQDETRINHLLSNTEDDDIGDANFENPDEDEGGGDIDDEDDDMDMSAEVWDN